MILNIYTWNILNPQPHISQMSWTLYSTSSNQSFEIATIDYERYKLHRIFILIKIIQYWIQVALNDKSPTIICLQEVNLDLLEKLKILVANKQISWSNDTDSNHRVTIVVNCEIVNSKEIKFNETSGIKCRSILLSNIKIKNKIYQCFNVHLHWSLDLISLPTGKSEAFPVRLPTGKSEAFPVRLPTGKSEAFPVQLDYVATIIKNNIDESIPFIIVGDFNKPIDLLESFMDQFDCIQFNKQINSKTSYTSMLTHIKDLSKPKKGIIDHILLSSDFITDENTKLKIISHIFKYKIFYNFKKIILLKNLSSQKWINKRKYKDISDHKPVKLEISI
jgi:endonuclease/exonuclease/phosphatase family metal-dependent hydrolase